MTEQLLAWRYWKRPDEEIERELAQRERDRKLFPHAAHLVSNDPPMRWQTTQGYLFETEEYARAYVEAMNAHFDAMDELAAIPPALSRQAYEQACRDMAHLGAECLSDAEASRISQYGEYWPWWEGDHVGGYTVAQHVTYNLAIRRQSGIEAETPPVPPRQPDYPNGRRLDCGHRVYWAVEIMGASRGTACPDCYDRMSDYE